jgi:hypothetical protein
MLDAALEALDAELADLDRGPAADSIE